MKTSDDKLQEFVCYSMPGSLDYHYCEISDQTISKSFQGYSSYDFVIAPFNKRTKPFHFLKFSSNSLNEDFECLPFPSNADLETSRDTYISYFNTFMNSIESSGLGKVVCSRIKKISINFSMISVLYKTLVRKYPDAFVYMWNTRNSGCWMGASPELLLKSESNRLKTVALAGTKPFVEENEKILWTAKEKEEQQIIVDYLANAFKESEIDFELSDTYTVYAGRMGHLKTDVYFRGETDMDRLLDIIHPGPAISGYPVSDAIRLIEATEHHDREYYTGFLGPIVENGQMEFFVNLRCMKMTDNSCSLYLGGGLTKDSDVEKEWNETELKSTTLVTVINNIKD